MKKRFTMRSLRVLLLSLIILLPVLFSACGSGEEAEGGTLIAAVSEGCLILTDPDTGDRTVVAKGDYLYHPLFSPDGTILYYTNANDIFWVPVSGGTPTLAAADAEPVGFDSRGRLVTCSPTYGVRAFDPGDGTTEFLWQTYSGGFGASALLSAGSARLAVQLVHEDVGILFPDGLDILHRESSADERLYSADVCGSENFMTLPFAWSADEGTLIVSCCAVGSERASLFALPIIEGAATLLTEKNITVNAGTVPAYAADGSCIAFPAYRSAEDYTRTVCTVNLKTLSVSYTPSPLTDVTGVALSPDGSKTVYTAGIAENGSTGLFLCGESAAICLTGDTTAKFCTAPKISNRGECVWFISVEDRFFAVTDESGNATGAYTETVASVSRCWLDTAGASIGADRIDSPDGVYNTEWAYMFDVYEAPAAENG